MYTSFHKWDRTDIVLKNYVPIMMFVSLIQGNVHNHRDLKLMPQIITCQERPSDIWVTSLCSQGPIRCSTSLSPCLTYSRMFVPALCLVNLWIYDSCSILPFLPGVLWWHFTGLEIFLLLFNPAFPKFVWNPWAQWLLA